MAEDAAAGRAHAADGAGGGTARPTRAEWLLVAGSLAFALVVQSGFFEIASWMAGDMAYHRGVALGMQGGDLQGQGPYAGLLTYYGGLYPLLTGWTAALTGAGVETVISVASWLAAVLWPLALWHLARRIWPAEPPARGLFVLLGTTAQPLTHRTLTWVNSVLASAQNEFPAYPRDVALILLVLLAAVLLAPRRRTRVAGGGILLGAIVLFHLQIAVLAGWLTLAWAAWRAARDRAVRPLLDAAAAAAIAAVVSAWWWLPRLAAYRSSGGLLLADWPGTPVFRLDPGNAVPAFGVVGLLVLLGAAARAAGQPLPGRLALPVAWLVAFVPLVAADRILSGFDLLSERRVWLLVSIPLTALAASTAAVLARRLAAPAAIAFVVLGLVAPSLPAAAATEVTVATAWPTGHAGGRVFDPAVWDPIWRDLNAAVRRDGGVTVLTYDALATWAWSFSGASVPSAWLPGPFKLGFDPQALTGRSYLDRLADEERAFGGGQPATCAVAREYGARLLLLEADGGLVGTRDATPAAAYRVDPRRRDAASIDRVVGPGLTYLDQSNRDVLVLDPGADWRPGWSAPDARRLVIEAEPTRGDGAGPLLAVEDGAGRHPLGDGAGGAPQRLRLDVPGGIGEGLAIVALQPMRLVRVTAFEPWSGPHPADGPFLTDAAAYCGAPA